MLYLTYQTIVTAPPEDVFHQVTGYPVQDPADVSSLQAKYGESLTGEGNKFCYQEMVSGTLVDWECSFDPPNRRELRAVGSHWSDRIDQFVSTPQGTLWKITWEVESSGLSSIAKWLSFQLVGKKHVERRVVLPALIEIYSAQADDS